MKSVLSNKLCTIEKLQIIVRKYKQQHKTIVWTNGCFDILHVGHVEYLEKAKALGEILIVGLNSDVSVKAIKGEKRPFFNEIERAKVLSALIYINFITIFNESSPLEILLQLKPDYYVKGGDYTIDTIDQRERRAVEDYGGNIKILPIVNGVSTSNIISKLYQL